MNRTIAIGVCLVCVLAQASAAQALEVMEDVNGDWAPRESSFDPDADKLEVGFRYTPSISYNLERVETRFSAGVDEDRVMTVQVYLLDNPDWPATGKPGTLLREADFSPLEDEFCGGAFEPLPFIEGVEYFVGIQNVGNHPVNWIRTVGQPSGTYDFLGSYHSDRRMDETYNTFGGGYAPIYRFVGTEIPEPATAMLLVGGLGMLVKRRGR